MKKSNPFLSIVTPTYNRAKLLGTCYESLLRQSDCDFEWIIVDDGSTDDTEAVVNTFQTDNFSVTYVKKENGGKHTALNVSHMYIQGEYVLILDSDDALIHTAVEEVRKGWEEYADQENIGLVVFLRGSSEEDPKAYAKKEKVPVDILRYKRVCVHSSDCCEVIRTELFKRYPFPVFAGEKFLSEGALWNRLAKTHKCVYINKVIYLCEYLEGGLTKSGRAMRIRNPRGGMYSSELCMGPNNFLKPRIKKGILFCCYGFFSGMSGIEIIQNSKFKTLTGLCLAPGYVLFRIWKKKYV